VKEFRILSSVTHPGIVQVHALETCGEGRAYMVMELLDGASAQVSVRQLGPPGAAERTIAVQGIIADVSVAARALHRAGWVHRDIKSANVMVLSGGQSVLIDPGAACRLQNPDRSGFVGTQVYAPPEQLLGRQVDERADVYALGVLSYRLLTGRPPFEADSPYRCLQLKLSGQPPPLRQRCPGLPRPAAAIIARMLSPEPERRPDMDEIHRVLSPGGDRSHAAELPKEGVLGALAEAPGPLSSAQLCRAAGLSVTRLEQRLQGLMSEGLIRRSAGGWCLLNSHIRSALAQRERLSRRRSGASANEEADS
jgi:serine/threonine protein kinase